MPDDTPQPSLRNGFLLNDWMVEPALNRLSSDDEEHQLEPKVMAVLVLLAEHAGRVVRKDTFFERVWADTVVSEDALSRCVSQLRKALGDDATDPTYIETIRKTGYRLIAPVEVLKPPAEPPTQPGSPPQDSTSKDEGAEANRPKRRLFDDLAQAIFSTEDASVIVAGAAIKNRTLWLIAGGALVLVGGVLAVFLWSLRPSAGPPSNPLSAVPLMSLSGLQHTPALSPDGQQVAFSWKAEKDAAANLYLKQQGAEEPLQLTTTEAIDHTPAWAPNGRFIAFVRSSATGDALHTVSSIGGSEQRIASFGPHEVQGLSWDPETDDPAFVVSLRPHTHRSAQLYLLASGSDSLQALTTPSPALDGGDTYPRYAPDGRRIAFIRAAAPGVQDLFVYDLADERLTQVTTDSARVWGLDWSADGEELLFSATRHGVTGLRRVVATGGDSEWMTTVSRDRRVAHPSVSRLRPRLAYALQSEEHTLLQLQSPVSGPTLEMLPVARQEDTDPAISPTGDAVAFISTRSGYPELWATAAAATGGTQLTSFEGPDTGMPRWSPDGTRLALISRAEGAGHLYVVNRDGSQLKQLTSGGGEHLAPAWAPDGGALYVSSNRSGRWEIWRVPIDGTPPAQVTRGGAMAAQPHPDGDHLLVVRPDAPGIWQVPLASTASGYPLTAATRADSLLLPRPRAIPAAPVAPQRLVASLDVRDAFNWVVTPQGIYFLERTDQAEASLTFYRFSVGRISPVFPLGPVPFAASLAAHPSGDWFVFIRHQLTASETLVAEDF
ncbi:MAG: hypothetical protein GVY15_02140 [Bacteroidetes bacterium]|jgi:Tol biopolymer transport system component/DNA-binding winged helix-turn-helix (wHTH) protein|nr:hypothetical protein [Bacteroidota bacterium]